MNLFPSYHTSQSKEHLNINYQENNIRGGDPEFELTVSMGKQSKVAVIPAAAPATNLSKFVDSSFPNILTSLLLYVS
jgi:hypothetical protein